MTGTLKSGARFTISVSDASRILRAYWDGARLRCPACHVGRMSRGIFHVADACPSCGVPFEVGRGEFTGTVMFAMGFLGVVALMGFFVLSVLLDYPDWVGIAWAVLTGFVIPFFMYRNLKGMWIATIHAFDDLRAAAERARAEEGAPPPPGLQPGR